MNGHDPNGVIVGLGQNGLGHSCPLGRLLSHPGQVLAQVAARCIAPGPRLVDDEAEPTPDVAWPTFGEPQFHDTPVPGDPVEQLRGCEPVALVIERTQIEQSLSDHVVIRHGLRLVGEVAPPPLAFPLEPEQVIVAACQERGPQRGDDVEVVGGIVDGPQHHEEVPNCPADVDERTRLGPVGDAGGIEGVLEVRQRRARR